MPRKIYFLGSIVSLTIIAVVSLRWSPILWSLVVVGPIVLLGVHDIVQRKHTLLRIYPVIGHGRYLMELLRPEIQQYFVEDNISGTPLSREMRSIIYQRAKGALDTRPFGTQRDVYRVGYEWINHSLSPKPTLEEEPRVAIGTAQCRKPYAASRLNISAMSFGSLSRNAIRSLNKGAKKGGFYHNTGEGGLSPYHLEFGGDVVWQIGTGYFGCRTSDGGFDPDKFQQNATRDSVRMIEIKLSQGAKPGHGGILPGAKVTEEIAATRGVPVGLDVVSPPAHTAFSDPAGLLTFVQTLRELSNGKPVGFKLCVGDPVEFMGICKAIISAGILPDFITVDGAEGGTGAAPLEFSNSVGTPLREGLTLVHHTLVGCGLRDKIRIIAAGKVVTAFHMFKTIALGADVCNSARGMMISLGCLQARRCHDNTCPTGVATQDPQRSRAVDVTDKAERVARYHDDTIEAFLELLGAAGLDTAAEISPRHVLRRVDPVTVKSYAEIYPAVEPGSFLHDEIDVRYLAAWRAATPTSFRGDAINCEPGGGLNITSG
ncbi:MAG: FMN-binding glutamate synthase family protein [Gemmatimonadales bacterium]